MQSGQSWSLPLCIVSKFGTISMKTDQNARMHNTLSDLSTRRLSCEQTEMIFKNYGKENNRGSDFRMRMQQTDSVMFYDVPYHKEKASKHKRRKPISRRICTSHQSFCYSQEQWMLRFWQFSAGSQVVQSFHYVMPRGHSCMLMGQKVQLGVY